MAPQREYLAATGRIGGIVGSRLFLWTRQYERFPRLVT
jgi:hypothetical protein